MNSYPKGGTGLLEDKIFFTQFYLQMPADHNFPAPHSVPSSCGHAPYFSEHPAVYLTHSPCCLWSVSPMAVRRGLDEVMDASSFSPAAWSQNTEGLVKRWLIFANGTVCCKQDLDHHIFISLDQRPHYLRLGHWLFVTKQREEAFWASVNYMKLIC